MRRCPNGWTTSASEPEDLMEGGRTGLSGSAPDPFPQLQYSVEE